VADRSTSSAAIPIAALRGERGNSSRPNKRFRSRPLSLAREGAGFGCGLGGIGETVGEADARERATTSANAQDPCLRPLWPGNRAGGARDLRYPSQSPVEDRAVPRNVRCGGRPDR
jgi:hypothetical protein